MSHKTGNQNMLSKSFFDQNKISDLSLQLDEDEFIFAEDNAQLEALQIENQILRSQMIDLRGRIRELERSITLRAMTTLDS
jgi:hypothetical protein